MKHIFITITAFVLLINCSCSDSGTKPADDGILDTTSHDFTFRLDTLGEYSSILNDVAIIDNDNIWAVGQIFVVDSSGNEQKYNAAVWNGQEWGMKRIPFMGTCSGVDYPEIKAVFYVDNQLIFSNGGAVVFYNFNTFELDCSILTTLDGQIRRFWASSKNNIYSVGLAGSISHYNGSIWSKLESNTNIDIQDIWGDQNPDTGEWEILALGSFRNYGKGLIILNINNQTIDTLSTSGLRISENSIWFKTGKIYYVAGDGIFNRSDHDKKWVLEENHPLIYKYRIRGTSANDIFVCGGFGLLSHYNGSTWKHHTDYGLPEFYGSWWSSDYKGEIFVAAGQLDNQGILLLGKK